MPNKPTAKSKYPSRYSPNQWVTAAQYVVEYVCEKKAKKEGKDLPTQFWQLPIWQKFFRSQVNTANSLIKKHGEEAVIKAVKNAKMAWAYSLRAPGFEAVILEERRNLTLKQKESHTSIDYDSIDTSAKPVVDFSSAKLSDKLRDL